MRTLAQLVPCRLAHLPSSRGRAQMRWGRRVVTADGQAQASAHMRCRAAAASKRQLQDQAWSTSHPVPAPTSGTPSHTLPMPRSAAPHAQKSSPLLGKDPQRRETAGSLRMLLWPPCTHGCAPACRTFSVRDPAACGHHVPCRPATESGTHLPRMSPCPPVWLSACPVNRRRGPRIVPSSTACSSKGRRRAWRGWPSEGA